MADQPPRLTPAKIAAHMRAALDAAFASGAAEVTVDYHGLRISARRAGAGRPGQTAADAALDAWERERP